VLLKGYKSWKTSSKESRLHCRPNIPSFCHLQFRVTIRNDGFVRMKILVAIPAKEVTILGFCPHCLANPSCRGWFSIRSCNLWYYPHKNWFYANRFDKSKKIHSKLLADHQSANCQNLLRLICIIFFRNMANRSNQLQHSIKEWQCFLYAQSFEKLSLLRNSIRSCNFNDGIYSSASQKNIGNNL